MQDAARRCLGGWGPLPTAGGQFRPGYPPLRLPKGASPWLPKIQPWITRIAPNRGQDRRRVPFTKVGQTAGTPRLGGGLALVSAALQPDDGRPLARPAVGSRVCRRRAPDPLNLVCLRRFLAAVLRIVRARSGPSSPSFVGACGPEILLRRSFLADFLRRFSVPCPAGRRDSTGTAPQASPAAKKQRGGEGSWPVTFGRPTHPTSRQEGATL